MRTLPSQCSLCEERRRGDKYAVFNTDTVWRIGGQYNYTLTIVVPTFGCLWHHKVGRGYVQMTSSHDNLWVTGIYKKGVRNTLTDIFIIRNTHQQGHYLTEGC